MCSPYIPTASPLNPKKNLDKVLKNPASKCKEVTVAYKFIFNAKVFNGFKTFKQTPKWY